MTQMAADRVEVVLSQHIMWNIEVYYISDLQCKWGYWMLLVLWVMKVHNNTNDYQQAKRLIKKSKQAPLCLLSSKESEWNRTHWVCVVNQTQLKPPDTFTRRKRGSDMKTTCPLLTPGGFFHIDLRNNNRRLQGKCHWKCLLEHF